MQVLITGAAGFLGRELVARLAAGAMLSDAQGRMARPTRLVLTDRVGLDSRWSAIDPVHPMPVNATSGGPNHAPAPAPTIEHRLGSLTDRNFAASLIGPDTACVFHLAGLVSGVAEADFDAGMQANIDGTRHLLEAMRADRAQARLIRLVHASSIAVYGAPLPARIDDLTEPRPTLSYGMQKLVSEWLIGDMSRRGLIDGRCLRLSGVVVRPALPVRVAEIVAAVARVAGRDVSGSVTWRPDPAVESMFGRWPDAFTASRASSVGFVGDSDIGRIVADHARASGLIRE